MWVWTALILAVLAQLLLAAWLARMYPTIPPRVPYRTRSGGRYFAWGSRRWLWSAPVAWLALLGLCAVLVATTPGLAALPGMAVPFLLMVAATPVVGWSMNDKIRMARRGAS